MTDQVNKKEKALQALFKITQAQSEENNAYQYFSRHFTLAIIEHAVSLRQSLLAGGNAFHIHDSQSQLALHPHESLFSLNLPGPPTRIPHFPALLALVTKNKRTTHGCTLRGNLLTGFYVKSFSLFSLACLATTSYHGSRWLNKDASSPLYTSYQNLMTATCAILAFFYAQSSLQLTTIIEELNNPLHDQMLSDFYLRASVRPFNWSAVVSTEALPCSIRVVSWLTLLSFNPRHCRALQQSLSTLHNLAAIPMPTHLRLNPTTHRVEAKGAEQIKNDMSRLTKTAALMQTQFDCIHDQRLQAYIKRFPLPALESIVQFRQQLLQNAKIDLIQHKVPHTCIRFYTTKGDHYSPLQSIKIDSFTLLFNALYHVHCDKTDLALHQTDIKSALNRISQGAKPLLLLPLFYATHSALAHRDATNPASGLSYHHDALFINQGLTYLLLISSALAVMHFCMTQYQLGWPRTTLQQLNNGDYDRLLEVAYPGVTSSIWDKHTSFNQHPCTIRAIALLTLATLNHHHVDQLQHSLSQIDPAEHYAFNHTTRQFNASESVRTSSHQPTVCS